MPLKKNIVENLCGLGLIKDFLRYNTLKHDPKK